MQKNEIFSTEIVANYSL